MSILSWEGHDVGLGAATSDTDFHFQWIWKFFVLIDHLAFNKSEKSDETQGQGGKAVKYLGNKNDLRHTGRNF